MIEKIRQRIQENMECSHLEILDESPSHGGYDGSVSHIKIIVVSDEFIDQSLINRHKLVYKSMGDFRTNSCNINSFKNKYSME